MFEKPKTKEQVTWLMDFRSGIDYVCKFYQSPCPWQMLDKIENNKNEIYKEK